MPEITLLTKNWLCVIINDDFLTLWGPLRNSNMSLVLRKPAFCICENKDADQLRGNCEADQCLCFRYADSKIPLLPKSEISCL